MTAPWTHLDQRRALFAAPCERCGELVAAGAPIDPRREKFAHAACTPTIPAALTGERP